MSSWQALDEEAAHVLAHGCTVQLDAAMTADPGVATVRADDQSGEDDAAQ